MKLKTVHFTTLLMFVLPPVTLTFAQSQVSEIDLSEYMAARGIESAPADQAEQTEAAQAVDGLVAAEVPTVDTQANPIPNQMPQTTLFHMPDQTDPMVSVTRQQQLLSEIGALATLMREIREQGNDEAVLAMLESATGSQENFELLRKVFDSLEVPEPPAAAQAATQIAPEAEQTPKPEPVVIHEIIPLFAQVHSDFGTRDKAIVSIGGRRFIRLPGEEIVVDGRRILIDAIESSINASGREIYTIWVMEDGKRTALEWQ